jgi:hypothetical protein
LNPALACLIRARVAQRAARRSKISIPIIPARALIVVSHPAMEAAMGRGILLWLLGVPIPVIILIALLYR